MTAGLPGAQQRGGEQPLAGRRRRGQLGAVFSSLPSFLPPFRPPPLYPPCPRPPARGASCRASSRRGGVAFSPRARPFFGFGVLPLVRCARGRRVVRLLGGSPPARAAARRRGCSRRPRVRAFGGPTATALPPLLRAAAGRPGWSVGWRGGLVPVRRPFRPPGPPGAPHRRLVGGIPAAALGRRRHHLYPAWRAGSIWRAHLVQPRGDRLVYAVICARGADALEMAGGDRLDRVLHRRGTQYVSHTTGHATDLAPIRRRTGQATALAVVSPAGAGTTCYRPLIPTHAHHTTPSTTTPPEFAAPHNDAIQSRAYAARPR